MLRHCVAPSVLTATLLWGTVPQFAISDDTGRTAELKKHLGNFHFSLTHHGPADKPFYALQFTTRHPASSDNPFLQRSLIRQQQAVKIIDFLQDSGVLATAKQSSTPNVTHPQTTPCYVLRVHGGSTDVTQVLPWDLSMLRLLDGLQTALDPPVAKSLQSLRDRLSGYRNMWEQASDASQDFTHTVKGGRLRFVREDRVTVIHIASERGIGNATIQPRALPWPRELLLRFHLRGLESLKINNGNHAIEVALGSIQPHSSRVSQLRDGKEQPLNRQSPLWTEVRVAGSHAQLPLDKNGFLEVAVPASMLRGKVRQLQLQWIDFYR